MPKEQFKQLIKLWEIAYKTYHDYNDQFFTKIQNGEVVKHARKVLDAKELKMIQALAKRENDLRRAWEQALMS